MPQGHAEDEVCRRRKGLCGAGRRAGLCYELELDEHESRASRNAEVEREKMCLAGWPWG